MPHEDGDAYGPVVATVSLGGSLCLDITHKPGSKEDPEFSTKDTTNGSASASRSIIPTRILQEPRSLLITTGKAYRDLMHGISPVEIDEDLNANTVANWNLLTLADEIIQAEGKIKRATRISLTYRDVLKVSSAASKVLGGFGRR